MWSFAATMNHERREQANTLLPDGTVLVAGGADLGFTRLASAELYEPSADSWLSVPDMSTPRFGATLLRTGKPLVVGGHTGSAFLDTGELYTRGP